MRAIASRLPGWVRNYRGEWFASDLLAGLVVTVMLVPQSLGYAMLAGLPPHVGLYASILPLIAYAAFGSSMTLAVGPVAIASLMTAAAVGPLAAGGSAEYTTLAALLALVVGVLLAGAGLLRLGFLSNLLSHSVVAGFITGAAILIVIGQLGPLLGIAAAGKSALELSARLIGNARAFEAPTALLGVAALVLLWVGRGRLAAWLERAGVGQRVAQMLSRAAPMAVVLAATGVVAVFDLDSARGVAVVGAIPAGLPSPGFVPPSAVQVQALLAPAMLIALVNFVESISVAQSLAARRRERVSADAELRGLGAANLASGLSGGFPVAGGFARSGVNFAAGARTPLAGIVAALLMVGVVTGATGVFERLPTAVLAATIIVAVAPLVAFSTFRHAWRYDRADALAFAGTGAGVLVLGVEAGIALGVGISLATLVWRTGRPHIAVVGRVPGSEHFRNVERHRVETVPGVLAMRVDENLLFTNARAVDERIRSEIDRSGAITDLLLVISSVSQIDLTALQMLVDLADDLASRGVRVSLAEVKGPVGDRIAASSLTRTLGGRVFLSTHEAMSTLARGRDAGVVQARESATAARD